jgi:hypothetical protein
MLLSLTPQHPTHRTQLSVDGLLLDISTFPSISGNGRRPESEREWMNIYKKIKQNEAVNKV